MGVKRGKVEEGRGFHSGAVPAVDRPVVGAPTEREMARLKIFFPPKIADTVRPSNQGEAFKWAWSAASNAVAE